MPANRADTLETVAKQAYFTIFLRSVILRSLRHSSCKLEGRRHQSDHR